MLCNWNDYVLIQNDHLKFITATSSPRICNFGTRPVFNYINTTSVIIHMLWIITCYLSFEYSACSKFRKFQSNRCTIILDKPQMAYYILFRSINYGSYKMIHMMKCITYTIWGIHLLDRNYNRNDYFDLWWLILVWFQPRFNEPPYPVINQYSL